MRTTVGRPIVVREVLSKATNLLMKNPMLLVPQLIVLVLSLIEDFTRSFSIYYILLFIISIIVSIIIMGAYPSLVQEALDGKPISIGNAIKQATGKFGTLFIAGIIVGLILFVGFIALIVPGLILLCWYIYTVPAIMLENKGALAGMSASKAFGRDKKWSTFTLLVVVVIVGIVIEVIDVAISSASALAGHVIYSLLSLPLDAWVAVIITYVYLTYGPSSAAVAAPSLCGPLNFPTPPPSPGVSASKAFCQYCGTPVQPGAQFCPNCGHAL